MSVHSYHGIPLTVVTEKRTRSRVRACMWLYSFLVKVRSLNARVYFSVLLMLGILTVAPLLVRNAYLSSFDAPPGTIDTLDCLESKARRSIESKDFAMSTESDGAKLIVSAHVVSVLANVSYSKCNSNRRLESSHRFSQNFLIGKTSSSDAGRHREIKVAAINLQRKETSALETAFSGIKVVPVNTHDGSNISWTDIYPDRSIPQDFVCPLHPPYSNYNRSDPFDIVVVNAPCNMSDPSWTKNVSRHLLLLAAAELAINHTVGDFAHVIVMSQCHPTPNLFRCSYLRERKSDLWLFHVDKRDMKARLLQPVGSCARGSPTANQDRNDSRREAYATILHSSGSYVCGAILLAASLKRSGTTRELVLLHDNLLGLNEREILKAAGWTLHQIERIRNPKSVPDSYNEWNYSKLRIWLLVQYSKIVFIDADIVVAQNMDFLFGYPELSAAANGGFPFLFNSGVMVIEPSTCTFDNILMPLTDKIVSYNNGDQGFLNEIFSWWHRLPYIVNFLKYTDRPDPNIQIVNPVFQGDPPLAYAIHYLGLKPWECYKDFDCNWLREPAYAQDDAFEYWWKLHDTLPEQQQTYCYMDESRKLQFDQLVSEAKGKNWTAKYLNVTVQDKRLHLSRGV